MKRTALLIHPTLQEVKLAASKAGLREIEAEKLWHFYESRGWKWGRSQPMKCWLSALSGWRLNWQERQVDRQTHRNGADTIVLQREYERVLDRLKAIPKMYDEHRAWSPGHKQEFERLKTRRDELRKKLGVMI